MKRITVEQAQKLKEKHPDYKADKLWVNYYIGRPHHKWKLVDYSDSIDCFSFCEFPAPTKEEYDKIMEKSNPFPIEAFKKRKEEIAKSWAEDVLSSREGKKLQKDLEKEFLEYVAFGTIPYYGNKDIFRDIKNYTELTASEIIERFSGYLTEDELKKLEDGRR